MSVLIRVFFLLTVFFFFNNCSNNGRPIDSTVWDDIINVSEEIGKGKSLSEALGSVK